MACDDLSALLASPLKLLFGATICVPQLGRFLLHKVDLAQLSAAQQGQTVAFEGEFVGAGAASASIALQCTVGSALVKLLLPLAQTLDVSKLDAAAFANALDITCVDKAGAHKIVVNKSSVTGIDAALLAKIFKVANVNVNTYGQVYQLLAGGALAIGPFKLENGKLVTPYGTFDAGQAIDFLKDVAVVKTTDGKLLSLSTPYGTVTLSASGELVFTGADGKSIALSSGCVDVHASGAAIIATCKQQKVAASRSSRPRVDLTPAARALWLTGRVYARRSRQHRQQAHHAHRRRAHRCAVVCRTRMRADPTTTTMTT